MMPLLLGGIGKEGADARKLARCRGRAETLRPPFGQKGAKVDGSKVEQARVTDLVPAISSEKFNQTVRGRNISAHRVGRASPVILKIARPLRRKCGGRVN